MELGWAPGAFARAPAAAPATLGRALELREKEGKRRRVPPPPRRHPVSVGRSARSAIRQDKVKNKQITTFAAAAAIALRKIIQALWGRWY